MTTLTAVARAVARDAETRARAALDDVVAAHTKLVDADRLIADATAVKAATAPALARAIDTALSVGVSTEQLAALGISVPSARSRRRTTRTPTPPSPDAPPRPAAGPEPGQSALPDPATDTAQPWPPESSHAGQRLATEEATPW